MWSAFDRKCKGSHPVAYLNYYLKEDTFSLNCFWVQTGKSHSVTEKIRWIIWTVRILWFVNKNWLLLSYSKCQNCLSCLVSWNSYEISMCYVWCANIKETDMLISRWYFHSLTFLELILVTKLEKENKYCIKINTPK